MAINVFTFSGNAGADMEVRRTPNNKCIGTFSLPAKAGWGDNEKTSWIQCKVLGERAEKLAQHVTKGTKVTVTGPFILEQWQHEGKDYSRPTVIVNDLDLGGSANQNTSTGNQSGYQQGSQQPAGNGRTSQPQQNGQQNNPPPMAEPDFDFDSDIPF